MHRVVHVVSGRRSWSRADGQFEEHSREQAELSAMLLRALRLAEWLLPLREALFELSPLGELKVGNRPALGIRVVEQGMPDALRFWFDKETGLLLKLEQTFIWGRDRQEVVRAFFF